jgi:hypothetical protein
MAKTITELRAKCKRQVQTIKDQYKIAKTKKAIKEAIEKAKRIFSFEETEPNQYEWRDRDLSSDDNYNGNFDDMCDELNKWAGKLVTRFRDKISHFIELDVDTSDVYGVVTIDVLDKCRPRRDVLFSELNRVVNENLKLLGNPSYMGWRESNGICAFSRYNNCPAKNDMYNKRFISFAKIYGINLEVRDSNDIRTFFYFK